MTTYWVEVISLLSRAVKYLSHPIQEELIALIGKAVERSLVSKINKAPFWSVILDIVSGIMFVGPKSPIIR